MLTEDLESEMSDSFLSLSAYHLSRKTTVQKTGKLRMKLSYPSIGEPRL